MNAYVAITEENETFLWLPNPNEQYSTPPDGAICWVSGGSDTALLQAAKDKFTGLGFTTVNATFYDGPGDKSIQLTVAERTDTKTIKVGDRDLQRSDTRQAVHA